MPLEALTGLRPPTLFCFVSHYSSLSYSEMILSCGLFPGALRDQIKSNKVISVVMLIRGR